MCRPATPVLASLYKHVFPPVVLFWQCGESVVYWLACDAHAACLMEPFSLHRALLLIRDQAVHYVRSRVPFRMQSGAWVCPIGQ